MELEGTPKNQLLSEGGLNPPLWACEQLAVSPLTLCVFPVQILLLEAAERSPALENSLPMAGTTAPWYEELLPDAFPLLNPGTALRKSGAPGGKPGLTTLPAHPAWGQLKWSSGLLCP